MCRVRTCPTTEPLVGAFRGCTPVSALQPNVQAKVGVRQDPPQQKLRAEIPYLLERKNERSRERNRRATAKKQRNPRRRLCSPLQPDTDASRYRPYRPRCGRLNFWPSEWPEEQCFTQARTHARQARRQTSGSRFLYRPALSDGIPSRRANARLTMQALRENDREVARRLLHRERPILLGHAIGKPGYRRRT